MHPQNVTVYINTNVSFPKVTFNRGGRVSENKRTSGRKVARPIPFFFAVRFLADNRPRRRPPLSDKTGARGGSGGDGGGGGGNDEKPGGLFQSCKSRLKVNVLKPRSMKLSARNQGGGGRYVSALPSAAT